MGSPGVVPGPSPSTPRVPQPLYPQSRPFSLPLPPPLASAVLLMGQLSPLPPQRKPPVWEEGERVAECRMGGVGGGLAGLRELGEHAALIYFFGPSHQ